MKLDKLVKTLKRELTANPVKAGALGLLLLVGLYFWGPLVWKWVGTKGPTAGVAATVAPTPTASTEQQRKVPAESGQKAATWQQIRKWRERDRLVQPAEFCSQWKEIFQLSAPAKEAATAETESPQAEVKPVVIRPEDVGIVLEGVAISSRSKRAIISGKVYRELDLVSALAKDGDKTAGKGPALSFKLVRIARRSVELERNGELFHLQLAAPDLATQGLPDDKGSPEKLEQPR